MTTQDLHIRLPQAHIRLIEKLSRKMGLDRTAVIKLALYELAVKHGLALEYRKEDDRD